MSFAQLGYAAFCFSFCGGSRLTTAQEYLSDGNTIDMTLSSEIDDLLCIKDYVKQLPFIDSKHLILVGGSQGGLVAALTAARCNSEIEKLILFLAERKEILSLRIIITHTENDTIDGISTNHIYFTGYCENEIFQGCISPEGCDTQKYYPDGVQISAEYTLIGLDSSGDACSLHIISLYKKGTPTCMRVPFLTLPALPLPHFLKFTQIVVCSSYLIKI